MAKASFSCSADSGQCTFFGVIEKVKEPPSSTRVERVHARWPWRGSDCIYHRASDPRARPSSRRRIISASPFRRFFAVHTSPVQMSGKPRTRARALSRTTCTRIIKKHPAAGRPSHGHNRRRSKAFFLHSDRHCVSCTEGGANRIFLLVSKTRPLIRKTVKTKTAVCPSIETNGFLSYVPQIKRNSLSVKRPLRSLTRAACKL